MHYLITKVGAELENRFLEKRMTGTHWSHGHYAHKFLSLESARAEASDLENVRILWVDESPRPVYGRWGEVNLAS